MLVFTVFCFSIVQFSIAQQQYGIGIFDNLFNFPRYCFCHCGLQRRTSGWLSGGEPTSPSQFPWLVTVQAGDQYFTGALISDRHVITVAEPLYNLPIRNISVTLGARVNCDTSSGLSTNIDSVAVHPDFSPVNLASNLAIIRLRNVVPFERNNLSPICLPSLATREAGRIAYTVSYNSTTCLGRVVSLPILSGRQCLTNTGNATLFTSDKGCLGPAGSISPLCQSIVEHRPQLLDTLIDPRRLASRPEGVLHYVFQEVYTPLQNWFTRIVRGSTDDLASSLSLQLANPEDVGSPVMTQWLPGTSFRLVGVLSSADCESASTPLYTRIADHLSWINSQIRSSCQCFSKF